MGELRRHISGSDTFMSGHQIKKIRGRSRRVPAWTKDDAKVAARLLKSFPNLAADPTHRERAARWARVIHLYFRTQMTFSGVAREMGVLPKTVENIVYRIYRAHLGKKSNGGVRSGRPTGRPKSAR